MPRIQMTRPVKVALILLRVYLLVMLALIVIKFAMVFGSKPRPTPAGPAEHHPGAPEGAGQNRG
jgi:hypothetical protein